LFGFGGIPVLRRDVQRYGYVALVPNVGGVDGYVARRQSAPVDLCQCGDAGAIRVDRDLNVRWERWIRDGSCGGDLVGGEEDGGNNRDDEGKTEG